MCMFPIHNRCLSASPELMREAMARLEQHWGSGHDRHYQPGSAFGALLHAAADAGAPGQPPHDLLLPRHLSSVLKFTQQRLHKPPSALLFEEIDAPLIVAFLDHLEKNRGLSVRSRNLRLTAIRSFFRYIAYELPTHSAQIQRVLTIPSKRFTRTLVRFLHVQKSMRCSTRLIVIPGSGGATMPSS